ncbi:MAG: hypothetical protein OEW99_04305 [Gammaproteobacteria bacterium]|nr:hypothetical protein [Gammaproteobacteria bacterium]
MNKYILPTLILGTLILTGCARHSKVIIDPQGIDMSMYQKDLAECQQLANQVDSKVVEGIIGGAIIGTIVGALSVWNNKGHHRGYHNRHYNRHHRYNYHNNGHHLSTSSSAKLGAISGGLLAGSGSVHKSNSVLKNCIADRGYRILN